MSGMTLLRRVVATTILSDDGDTDFWTPQELTEPAFYVSKVAAVDGYPGLGSALLDWCGWQAARRGGELLRLDAWRTNPDLHRYYLTRGFRHVRTVEVPGRNSGALFERPARNVITDSMREHGLADPSTVEVTMSDADDTIRLPANLRTHVEMVADEHGVPFEDAVVLIIGMGLTCRANHDRGIEEQIALSELLASITGGGDEGRAKRTASE